MNSVRAPDWEGVSVKYEDINITDTIRLVVSLRANDQGQGPLCHRSGRYVQGIQVDASAHSPGLVILTSKKTFSRA